MICMWDIIMDTITYGFWMHGLFPFQLVDFMNLFCACLDSRIAKFNVYNVHTMGDEYMVVSGMPTKNGKPNLIPKPHLSSHKSR